jgi:gas vesicle protein
MNTAITGSSSMFRNPSDRQNELKQLQNNYKEMSQSEKDQLNQELKESEVNERMGGQFNGLSNTVILDARNAQ